MEPSLALLTPSNWRDYELLDSGNGARLERFGAYRFVRPETQAVWKPNLSPKEWATAHAIFQASSEETGGRWQMRQPIEPSWRMQYKELKFWARLSNSRHLGVFPEQAPHWDWVASQVRTSGEKLRVLNLFGYTGLASLAAAQAGAQVTHVDAAKKSVAWARENQQLSSLGEKPIRWIVDDALKFVQREDRRGQKYDGIILDPPKFGRGPQGQVWEAFEKLPELLDACRQLLSAKPRFLVITAYAIRLSALSLYYAVQEMLRGLGGYLSAGELALPERSASRLLSTAIFARWSAAADPSTPVRAPSHSRPNNPPGEPL